MDELIQQISKIPLPQRILALALAMGAIMALTYFVFVSPKQAEIERSEAKIKKLDSDLIQKEAIARNLGRYRIEVERLKQRLNEALTLLPNEAEIPELLQKIAARVEQSDCEMASFEPQGEIRSGFYAKIPVKMSIRGNFHSILVFFDKVSKLSRIVNVTDISLDKPAVENKKVILNAEFLATTFKFVEAAPNANTTGFGSGGS